MASAAQRIVNDINTHVPVHQRIEVYKGAHVVIRGDRGRLHGQWKGYSRMHIPRLSGHPHRRLSQYEVRGFARHGCLLVGLTPAGDTFFQFERHSGIRAHSRKVWAQGMSVDRMTGPARTAARSAAGGLSGWASC